MTIYIIYLLLVGGGARVAFDDKPSVQVFEPVKQQLTEHGTVLCAFFVFTA